VSLTVSAVTAGHAHQALADAVGRAKQGEPLRPVTVIVPTNAAGVAARRQLGRLGGVAAVDIVTLHRLAERLAGPALRAEQRLPVSSAVIDLAVREVLAATTTAFDAVREHSSTVVALRDLYRAVRSAGQRAAERLALASRRGRDAMRVLALVAGRLEAGWYDEGDLLATAVNVVAGGGLPAALGRVVVFLPQSSSPLETELLTALAASGEVELVLGVTGDRDADRDVLAVAAALGAPVSPRVPPGVAAEVDVVSVTDADEEVRHAVRAVVAAARSGTPLARIAVLWPSDRPYARLVEHHLDLAGIAWNGRPGTKVGERLVPRFLLDLLDVDRRGLRRRDVFELLADIPVGDGTGQAVPVAAWERVSRDAGVVRDEHWTPRLRAYAQRQRQRAANQRPEEDDDEATRRQVSVASADHAEALAAFIAQLGNELGRPSARRRWSEWVDWSVEQIDRRVGAARLHLLDEAEQQAWEHTSRVLDRLRHLDAVSGPATRSEFRSVFAAEFDVAPGRLGRIGAGVTIGSLAGAVGIVAELAIVLGAADGLMPAAPSVDPLLADSDRRAAGLATSDAMAMRAHRQLLGVLDTATRVIVLTPRGDLRTSTVRQPSRWLSVLGEHSVRTIASHAAGLLHEPFPANLGEHRLRRHAAEVLVGGATGLASVADSAGDRVLARALALRAARRRPELTVFDGDLSGVGVPGLTRPVSPTQLQAWTACPHAYFVRYVLGVKPIEEPGDELSITAADRGNVLHEVLDLFHREVINGDVPQPGPDGWGGDHRARLGELLIEVTQRYERAGRTGRPAFWEIERLRVASELLLWADHDSATIAARGAVVIASEHRFGGDGSVTLALPDGRRLAVYGTIDRIDRAGDERIVTDHKSGRADKYTAISALDPTAARTMFQLPAYAAAAAIGDGATATPVTAEYSFFSRGGFKRIGYRFEPDVWNQVAADLQHVVSGIEGGWYPPTPEKPQYQFYIDCHYCQPDSLGTAERFAEWDRKRHDPRLATWFAEP
jgi:ATP-dependent helicase/nuclease subunit B